MTKGPDKNSQLSPGYLLLRAPMGWDLCDQQSAPASRKNDMLVKGTLLPHVQGIHALYPPSYLCFESKIMNGPTR